MPILSVDVTDTYEDLWDAGLARLIDSHADAAVTVDDLDTPIIGALAYVGRDGQLVIDQRPDDDTVGAVVIVPLNRVVSVQATYQLVDTAAERRARVEADTAFLARVLELAAPLADKRHHVGSTVVTGATAAMLRAGLHPEFSSYDLDHIEEALQVLEDRGDLPPRAAGVAISDSAADQPTAPKAISSCRDQPWLRSKLGPGPAGPRL